MHNSLAAVNVAARARAARVAVSRAAVAVSRAAVAVSRAAVVSRVWRRRRSRREGDDAEHADESDHDAERAEGDDAEHDGGPPRPRARGPAPAHADTGGT
jgi:hypothetical protein